MPCFLFMFLMRTAFFLTQLRCLSSFLLLALSMITLPPITSKGSIIGENTDFSEDYTSYSSNSGFYWCIVACMCHGFSQAFGEATLMGYLKGLPSDLVMTFGSGTGVSGFTGVLSVLFLQALESHKEEHSLS